MNYGLPFQGSKSGIAKEIIRELPSGKRLVDLFGGGGAITHCALLSGKWESVYYNDIDPLLPELIKKAVNGEYSYKNFQPKFITREEFHEKKNIDGYIKYVWSFGNNGITYLFGKDIEHIKKAAHDYVVFGKKSNILNEYCECEVLLPNDKQFHQRGIMDVENDITERRLYLYKIVKSLKKRNDLQQLQQLERLEWLQQLERLEWLQQLELHNHDYREYQHKDGDVVYCDIPYENTASYQDNEFNHKEFYEWAKTRPYPVYFSSYEISDENFNCIFEIKKRVTYKSTANKLTKTEKLYTTAKAKIEYKQIEMEAL
jgi:16S rRNA G966 N2-methylase RsmD